MSEYKQPDITLLGDEHVARYRETDGEVGFEWNGAPYRSLTAVAKAVTGTHWNGKLFFGISQRRKRG